MNIESGHIIITVLVLIVLAMGWLFVLNTQELQELKAFNALYTVTQTPPAAPPTPPAESITMHRSRLSTHTPKPISKMEAERGHAVVSDC